MKPFSVRKGLKPAKSVVQLDSIDRELHNGLWNALHRYYWEKVSGPFLSDYSNATIKIFIQKIWVYYFNNTIDTLDNFWRNTYDTIRNYFFKCQWFEVYDFIEYVVNNTPEGYREDRNEFIRYCNVVLEKEISAYRFANGIITQITSEEEIDEIEDAIKFSPKTVNLHLTRALELLSNRKEPDYRNSIKESISAIESICKIISSDDKATLGKALKILSENKVALHPALENGFKKIYGYTSNADGIRHALLSESNLNFEDAKFMLVACSAFINYLITKSSKAGVKFT